MAKLINPKVEITIKGTTDIVIPNDLNQLFIEFDINKDLSEEPNTCEITIYNVGPDMLARINSAENEEAPIEIRTTASGVEEYSLAYGGEITDVYTEPLNPGHATRITCESQKVNHRAYTFDVTYEAGTPQNEIVDALIETIGLPTGNIAQINTTGISLSQTLSGPAFPLLEEYIFDMGLRAYITDGILHITSIYEPGDFSVFKIIPSMIRGEGIRETTRVDNSEIEMRTVVESTGSDPFQQVRPKEKKTKKAWGSGSFVEYEGVDKTIKGLTIPLLMQPEINPDQIITIDMPEYSGKYYRVQSVNHVGSNETFDEWDTNLEVDVYEDTGGDILAL